ncbi:MAG: hypothetical protein NTX94_05640, partial [Caldiserica bacterium]|nr:hypothetical protein [Caldisericota bacterium]
MRSQSSATTRTCSAHLNLHCRRSVCLLLVLGLVAAAVPPVVHVDAASTWARTFRGSGNGDAYGKGIVRMPDGDLVVAGTLAGGLLVTRLSPEGDVRWSNTYGTGASSADETVGVIACSPSGLLVFRGATLVRLNDSGTVRWSKNYSVYNLSDPSKSTTFTGAAQLSDGGFAVSGIARYRRVFLCRLTRDGEVVWANQYPLEDYNDPRIFALPGGGLLLGGTTPNPTAYQTGPYKMKLLWLNNSGRVTRQLLYGDATATASSYAQMYTMTMTPTGPVLCQMRYSYNGCGGTVVIKLDNAGDPQWATWAGSTGNGAVDLWGVDAAADGSLLLVGATTEFSEHDVKGYDGLVEKLTPGGDVAWVSTVDRGVYLMAGKPGAVVAMNDGGLAWAVTYRRERADDSDVFVIRMGPDGTAGKLGSYLTLVDVGNPRVVRIEHPTITSKPAEGTTQPLACKATDAEVAPSDAGLGGTDVEGTALAMLTLKPLYPADAATTSTIMRGGTLYRYYTALDVDGNTVAGAQLTYHGPFSDTTWTAVSDEYGEIVFSLAVPGTAELGHIEHTITIDRVRVRGLRSELSSKPDFATDVQALSWSTNWMMGYGIGGKAGIELAGAAEQGGGMVVTRTQADPAKEGAGSLMVTDSMSSEVAVGVSAE